MSVYGIYGWIQNFRHMQMKTWMSVTMLGDAHCGKIAVKEMQGRCLCISQDGLVGMGTGFMAPGNIIIIVPLDCCTLLILCPEGIERAHMVVGDVYISGYMRGEAIDEWKAGTRKLNTYTLHWDVPNWYRSKCKYNE
jgi:hypothetical protein